MTGIVTRGVGMGGNPAGKGNPCIGMDGALWSGTMLSYTLFVNGAGIRTVSHPDTERALESVLLQARQWKNSYFSKSVRVEESNYSRESGFVPTGRVWYIESPCLVPELTPEHDFDSRFPGRL